MDLGIAGKVALVTAASKGMGKACALGLAAEGARLVICARTEAAIRAVGDEIHAKTGAEVLALAADVTLPADIAALGARAIERFGGVDILVTNSGGPPRGNFDDVTDEQWHQSLDISLLSVVRLMRVVVPSMRARRWGRILAIQSTSVKQPVEGLLLSNAVRPGVAGLMKTLVPELGKDGILMNVVCPGRILTDRFIGGAQLRGLTPEEFVQRASAEVPLARIGTPEEFANVVVFLASEKASYVTGVTIQIDGGLIRGLL